MFICLQFESHENICVPLRTGNDQKWMSFRTLQKCWISNFEHFLRPLWLAMMQIKRDWSVEKKSNHDGQTGTPDWNQRHNVSDNSSKVQFVRDMTLLCTQSPYNKNVHAAAASRSYYILPIFAFCQSFTARHFSQLCIWCFLGN